MAVHGREHYDTLIPIVSRKPEIIQTNQNKLRKRKSRRFKRYVNKPTTSESNDRENKIVNLSDVTLSSEQENILKLGPKFCPTPLSLNHNTLSLDISEGCRKIRLKELYYDENKEPSVTPKFYKSTGYSPPTGRNDALDAFCSSVKNKATCLVSEKNVKSNLQLPMRKALQQLRKLVFDRTIRISRADKGGAVVIQNTEDYISEGKRQLSNPLHYSQLKLTLHLR